METLGYLMLASFAVPLQEAHCEVLLVNEMLSVLEWMNEPEP